MARVLASRELPSALDHWVEIEREFGGPNVAVFLDYDGTLTPIAPRPELAVLASDVRALLERVREAVHAGCGVRLETEIVFMGET